MQKFFDPSNTTCLRRKMRKAMPLAEVLLWQRLRERPFYGAKFRRQHGVGSYVLDFYCAAWCLGIELDGDSHGSDGAQEYDAEREAFLKKSGVTVIRFLNSDMYQNLDAVIVEIGRHCGGGVR